MRKFLAVVRHEYKKVVYKWTFVVGTLLFPIIGIALATVPAIIFSLKGEPTRLVVIDHSERVLPRLKENVSAEQIAARAREAAKEQIGNLSLTQEEKLKHGSSQLASGFEFRDFDASGKADDAIRRELNAKAAADEIDAYLIIPADITAKDTRIEFYSRRAGDLVANDTLRDAVNEAIRSVRLAGANIDEAVLREVSRDVKFDAKAISEKGEEKDSESLFVASMVIGMLIYLTLTIYGQVIMGAVVEEKETRIAEILFSSARPFELLFGKLVGVGLAGLTQLGIWLFSLLLLIGFAAAQTGLSEFIAALPSITPVMIVYFLIYFTLGYFIYASMFALIGSAVTTVQEGGQFAFVPVMTMLIGFYFCFAVIRDPNSSLSFWVSVLPLFAPLTMPVRILAEMPPFWQLALSIGLNSLAIVALVWLAARVYRVGMLMYGKRATVPEILKWVRQR